MRSDIRYGDSDRGNTVTRTPGEELHVVIVEMGEYSDRNDWIGGIFISEEEAKEWIKIKSAEARQQSIDFDKWQKKRFNICRRMRGDEHIWKLITEQPKQYAALALEAGPPPQGEIGETFYLVKVPLNRWGRYSYVGKTE